MKAAKAAGTLSNSKKSGTAGAEADAIALLKADHRSVEKIFAQYEQTEDENTKRELARQACLELIVHTKLEEELFYAACRQAEVESDLLDEAQVEHDGAKILIADLLKGSPTDEFYDAKVKTLSEYIKHHVGEEERPRTGIFAKAKSAGIDLAELGSQIRTRKTELMAKSDALTSRPPQLRSIHLQPQETTSMARNSNDRDRDERGRFTDDDDRGSRGSRGGYGAQSRDSEGRFTSDGGRDGRRSSYDDDDRYQSRSRDDDRSSSRGRGHGGWYGDSQGHSQASREGWEDRGNMRSRDYDDDDRGSRSRQGGGRGHGGWFGDSEGHSEASREGWRHSDHEGSGWYGDSQGHSQAAREGWEDRGRYSGRQSGRGRDDDDDYRQRRGGQGHGGWFGDPEGHSQASREGWRNR